jgi:CspA family cold shock protein
VRQRPTAFLIKQSIGAKQVNDTVSNTGVVKWFDEERGYGFLDTQDGDLFVHISAAQFGMKLKAGDAVTFEVAPDKKSGRSKAVNVRAA